MASGTINGSTGNQYIDSKIEWSATADTSANTSTVTAKLYYKRNNTGFTTSGTGSFSLTIGGTKKTASKYMEITGSAWALAMEASATITHGSDGSKSITISATGSIPDTTLSSTSCSGTAKLDTIPRASSITSAAAVTLGKACSVKWTPLSKAFRYKLKFVLDDWSYTTGAIHPNTTSAYVYDDYVIPLAVAEQLPKAKTGTMTVYLYTYSNTDATTQVGSASSKTFTVTVPSNSSTQPDVSMTLSTVTSLGGVFAGLYIQRLSKVKATFTGEGKYDADISSYRMTLLGKNYSSPYESDYLSQTGTITVTGRATDTRGYYSEVTKDITVIPYSRPEILPASGTAAIICARCDSTGKLSESGTYLKIKARRSYSKVVSGGVQKNFCQIRYRYREEGTNTFSAWKTLLAKDNVSTDTIDSSPISGVVPSTQTSYVVQVGVVDDIGETAAVQFVIPTDFITIDIPEEFRGRRAGIFRYVEGTDEDGLYVGLPIFGGSVDSLKLGTLLTATEAAPIDLNDYKIPGCYYSPNGTNSQYIHNTPYTGGGFGLEVRELQNTSYISQTLYYGRSRFTRHWNGSEWCDWLRFLMTTHGESTVTDFVVEAGTSNGWTYKKWKSGTYEMFGVFAVKTTVAGTALGSLYYSEQFVLPSPFTVENAILSGSALSWFFPTSGGLASVDDANNNIGFRLYRPTAFEAGLTVSVRLHVTGTLK